jgi:hypothetical protein
MSWAGHVSMVHTNANNYCEKTYRNVTTWETRYTGEVNVKNIPAAMDCRFLAAMYHQKKKKHFGFKHDENGNKTIRIFL